MSFRLVSYLFVAVVLTMDVAEAATKTTLHHFTGADGAWPGGEIGMDASGALYGAADAMMPDSKGVIYRLAPPKAGATQWSQQILHTFKGGVDGRRPMGVTVWANGTLVGTTMVDGTVNGTVFMLRPPASASGGWTYRIIWSFKMKGDAGVPFATVKPVNGKLYGTTESDEQLGYRGTVYELTPSKTAPTGWSEKVIATYIGYPHTAVASDAGGHIFVSSVVPPGMFRLTPPLTVGGAWTKEFLFHAPGYEPSTPILGGNGRIWGSVNLSGRSGQEGAIYYADPPATVGGSWTVQSIWTFTGGADGARPGHLTRVGNRFYGTTVAGGAGGAGTIFRLDPPVRSGAAWNMTVLHAFAGGVDGDGPSGLILRNGTLYGTTYRGGNFDKGTVFAFTP